MVESIIRLVLFIVFATVVVIWRKAKKTESEQAHKEITHKGIEK